MRGGDGRGRILRAAATLVVVVVVVVIIHCDSLLLDLDNSCLNLNLGRVWVSACVYA